MPERLPLYESMELAHDFWKLIGANFQLSEEPWNKSTSDYLRSNSG